ncbi:MAG: ComF family protein [Oscillospiraceae bacterium]|nr:ComF family protein [Oscillospiraceae bacterium]
MILNRLGYLFFPRRCFLCGELVLPSDELCKTCEKYISDTPMPKIENGILSPFIYDGAIRSGLLQLKFERAFDGVTFFAQSISKILENFIFDGICYVPLHPKRERQRGYNQSRLLAQELGKILDLPVLDVLTRLRDTPSQRNFKSDERWENVNGAFGSADVKNQRLLLIDDIATTGATLFECAKALRKSGAANVIFAVVATTQLPPLAQTAK